MNLFWYLTKDIEEIQTITDKEYDSNLTDCHDKVKLYERLNKKLKCELINH